MFVRSREEVSTKPDVLEIHVWTEGREDCVLELIAHEPDEGWRLIDESDWHPFDSEIIWRGIPNGRELVEVVHVTSDSEVSF